MKAENRFNHNLPNIVRLWKSLKSTGEDFHQVQELLAGLPGKRFCLHLTWTRSSKAWDLTWTRHSDTWDEVQIKVKFENLILNSLKCKSKSSVRFLIVEPKSSLKYLRGKSFRMESKWSQSSQVKWRQNCFSGRTVSNSWTWWKSKSPVKSQVLTWLGTWTCPQRLKTWLGLAPQRLETWLTLDRQYLTFQVLSKCLCQNLIRDLDLPLRDLRLDLTWTYPSKTWFGLNSEVSERWDQVRSQNERDKSTSFSKSSPKSKLNLDRPLKNLRSQYKTWTRNSLPSLQTLCWSES